VFVASKGEARPPGEEEKMRYGALVAVALVAAIATYTATAWSAAPPTPTEKKLLKDVRTLKSQVTKLQKTDKTHATAINTVGDIAVAAIVFSVCSTEATADAVQGTWQIIDQISAATQAGKTYFGTQTAVPDSTLGGLLTAPACQALKVIRSQALPPTAAQFNALIAALTSSQLRHELQLRHG
jgi:hypothetical protein